MSILNLFWIVAWLSVIYSTYPEALPLAFASHVVTRLVAPIATRIFGVLWTLVGITFIVWAMYTSVDLYGWGCFWLILISHLWVKVTYYPSGTVRGVEGGLGG